MRNSLRRKERKKGMRKGRSWNSQLDWLGKKEEEDESEEDTVMEGG